ncbi:uncharacterized protein LOC119584787 [Penaeus monodon]|uniref:uncharacterized protein LOC119584787 n=1 Tax=Penaeus monodon TaxID=6687 RepID=UPI0018A7DC49|nr:uncharacterized protein LOC119584787 [Penaeus monodon]
MSLNIRKSLKGGYKPERKNVKAKLRQYGPHDNRTPHNEDKYEGNIVNSCKHGDPSNMSNPNFIEKMDSFVKKLRKPNMDIKPFDGNSLEFNRFFRQFRSKVLNYCTSYDERFNYLEQFTSGEAKERIQEFMSMNPEQGYKAAMKELEDCYGNNDAVAQAYIKKALDWPVIEEMICKYDTLSMDSVKTLENQDNMRKLVTKLPYNMQEKWRTIICEKGKVSKPIVFSDLADFIKREAKKAKHPVFGRDILAEELVIIALCFKKEICLQCNKEHPTIMHIERMFNKAKQNTSQDGIKIPRAELEKSKCENMMLQKKSEQHEAQNPKEVININAESCHALSKDRDKIATLAIIPVKVKRKNSHKTIQTLAFLDLGATTTICSEKLMHELECKGKRVPYNFETLTGKRKVSSMVLKDFQISALTGNYLVDLSNVHSQDKINICKGFMPSKEDVEKWPHLRNLEIPQFDGEVGLLIGNNNLEAYRPVEIISGEEYCLIAAKTRKDGHYEMELPFYDERSLITRIMLN